jgi:hypothetical protein
MAKTSDVKSNEENDTKACGNAEQSLWSKPVEVQSKVCPYIYIGMNRRHGKKGGKEPSL